MANRIRLNKAMNLLFLLTLFFIPVEMSVTINIGFLSPYKITFLLLIILVFYSAIRGNFLVYVKSFIRGFMHFKWAIISIVLYFIFDIVSLAWTNDIVFSLKKYVTIFPMLVLAVYATYYLYGPDLDPRLRKERVRNLALVFALIALGLSLLTWTIYLIFARTYYILSLSLQSDYNQYVLPIIIGFVCGVYYINTMKPCWQRYVLFFAYSLILMPNFYLSGSRRIIVMYMLVYIALSIYFTITNLSYNKSILSFLASIIIVVGVLIGHQVIIDGFEYYSKYVYDTMEEEAKRQGIKPPSAQMDKSDGIIHGFRLEKDIDFKEDTLESGEAMGRREALWTIAINEIKSFSPKELVLGRGGSYQRDIYRTEEAREILFYDDWPPDTGQDFHPHSMILIEILNGGIIKLGLVISVVLSMIYYLFIILFRRHFHEFTMIAGYGAIFLSSQMIDSIYGLLQNRITWFFFFIVLGSLGKMAEQKFDRPK